MELWIRSQNKERLFKVDGVGYMLKYGCTNSITDLNGRVLGEYDNREKCLEIIDEIQQLLVSNLFSPAPVSIPQQPISALWTYIVYSNKCQQQPTPYLIYEMPEN